MEYCGYGIYKSRSPSEKTLLGDAEHLINFLIKELNIDPNKICLIGRSLGTGIVCDLASKYKFQAIILISAFTSIKNAARSMFGNFGSFFVKERFNNLEKIKKVRIPVLFIHGRMDRVISCEQSKILYGNFFFKVDACDAYCLLSIPDNMTHSEMSYLSHLVQPIRNFWLRIGFKTSGEENLEFPESLFDYRNA